MSWGATAKELENTTFFEELGKVIQRFKYTFAFCFFCCVIMVLLAYGPFVPTEWQIHNITAIWPLTTVSIFILDTSENSQSLTVKQIVFSHFMLPIALNPNLIVLKW